MKLDIKNWEYITSGGEADIYKDKNKDILYKIFKPHINIKSKEDKVKYLLQHILPDEIVKPIDIIFNNKNKFVGYVMKMVVGNEMRLLSNNKYCKANNVNTKLILSILMKIRMVMEALHNRNIIIGDFNDQNILFDDNYNIYFIDCDSWSIDNNQCDCAMDIFLDPEFNNKFTKENDFYSFCIISWKLLTRVHPFGGTYKPNPDMNLIDRMKNRICAINNTDVIIPKIAKTYKNLSPEYINCMLDVFVNNKRDFDFGIMNHMNINLKYCSIDNDYYYNEYQTCPICHNDAKLGPNKPKYISSESGFKIYEALDSNDVKLVLNRYIYLNKNDNIVDIKSNNKVQYKTDVKYYFTTYGYIEDYDNKFVIYKKDLNEYTVDKLYKSNIVIDDDKIYYIDTSQSLICVTNTYAGYGMNKIATCSAKSYFAVSRNDYCVLNIYNDKIIININNKMTILDVSMHKQIINYGIRKDIETNNWLILLQTADNKFITLIYSNTCIELYNNNKIMYQCSLDGVEFSNNTLYIPMNSTLRGYSYSKNIYKDFNCDIINDNSKIYKNGKKIYVVNDENLYVME